MEHVQLTSAHWYFLLIIVTIFAFMIFRRDIVLPSIIGIFGLGLFAGTGNGFLNTVINGMQVVFKALLNSAVELFDIMLVIALMVAMLKSLQKSGADVLMVAQVKKLMVNRWAAFFVLGITIYIAATFFWPTPAVALVGTVLVPIAMQVGLPAMGAAVAVNLFGHGMALSGDLVIQGAARLTAKAAGLDISQILPYTAFFSLTVGFIAIAISFYTIRRDMKNGILQESKKAENFTAKISKEQIMAKEEIATASDGYGGQEKIGKLAKLFAVLVPLVLLAIVILFIYRAIFDPAHAIKGGAATALLGGVAVILLILSTFSHEKGKAIEEIVTHLREGFFFAVKIFAPIIPIAAFFLLGHPDHAAKVLGEGSTGYLYDLGTELGQYIGGNHFILTFGIVFIALITGLEGSGFAGLPLVGALSASLGTSAHADVAVLASLGQVATIFAGGGTITAWAFGVVADCGIAGVKPADLVRRNLIPTMAGLFVSCIIAIFLM
ncbi:hypothetical protein ACI7RC_07055 [Brevibacillus sp. B_LB10_24]|uniref:hypothetical protein n=1 Tax=Brevibacillus sp. B_LB10_24 TaxID=3380645 RepID=UPI0038BDFF35